MIYKIRYNSPVALTFSIICTVVFVMNVITYGAIEPYFSLAPSFNYESVKQYFTLFSYILGHAFKTSDGSIYYDHLLGNLTFVLLLGPILEEKYGSIELLQMIIVTALLTAIINIVFFDTGIVGASGIVFMFIILSSFTNMKKGGIPLTFILIMILYIGKEVINSFSPSNISHYGHIAGGIIGSLFGFSFKPKNNERDK